MNGYHDQQSLDKRLNEFMAVQDKRASHQEKCISDMAKQVGKLAKAVEGLCVALGPAVKDSINNTMGPTLVEIQRAAASSNGGGAHELQPALRGIERVASDLSSTAQQLKLTVNSSMSSGGGNSLPQSPMASGPPGGGVDPERLAAALAPRIRQDLSEELYNQGISGQTIAENILPRIENIVARALDSRQIAPVAGNVPAPAPATPYAKPAAAPPQPQPAPAPAPTPAPAPKPTPVATTPPPPAAASTAAPVPTTPGGTSPIITPKSPGGSTFKGTFQFPGPPCNDEEGRKVHSAVRWDKPLGELSALIVGPNHANYMDPKNGNRPIHIAAQNGFLHVVKLLVSKGAEVNAQNNKGNTPLHMSNGYDYHDVSEFLISSGADQNMVNGEGHRAKNGLEGDKGPDGYVPPVEQLREARTVAETMVALQRVQNEKGAVDKASLAQVGMLKRKNFPDSWSADVQALFADVMKNF